MLALTAVVVGYLALLAPTKSVYQPHTPPSGTPFEWKSDAVWASLEELFKEMRSGTCNSSEHKDSDVQQRLIARLDSLEISETDPGNDVYRRIERDVFVFAARVAACQTDMEVLVETATRVRRLAKIQSRHWDMGDVQARRLLYRLLYGTRAAVEEALLQGPVPSAQDVMEDSVDIPMPYLVMGTEESSQTPSVTVRGVTVHSGDILVSRGGAAASALIARGNDYPGNFSHVALVHVDERTGTPTIAEAHIERGVALASVSDYLEDKKLRIMVLRPRADLTEIVADPQLPHRAATFAVAEANARHIPYDFAMNWSEPAAKFCSEVAYDAYARHGLHLWMGMSTMSRPGLIRWLSHVGVRYFETHEPSDLEYDPQLTVVAEWRGHETLLVDHIDNALVDAMLEGADGGDDLDYSPLMLPPTRLAKWYSAILNRFEAVGPVPEGMSATTALRVKALSARHGELRMRLLEYAEDFQTRRGYVPPYWQLLAQARNEVTSSD